ncbi:S1C family serine protease [Desulfogranum japonicum]|uniref:S1C family serine protease n=1 Tax=Desulfogranum japonicum TaxID=231447 RepID=UPI0004175E60|nr:S1C family serine protease [Desulfogranum japonicum]
MKCPKCGFRQGDVKECQKCGLIFAKYEAAQNKKQRLSQQPAEAGGSKGLSLFLLLAIVAAALGVGIFIGQKGTETTSVEQADTSLSAVSETEKEKTVVSEDVSLKASVGNAAAFQQRRSAGTSGLVGQLEEFSPTHSPVEVARNATVSLVSPWGSGSGFFIDSHGTIITNRHVVEVDNLQLGKLQQELRQFNEYLENERRNLTMIRKRVPDIQDKAYKDQVLKNTALREREYKSNKQRYEKLNERFQLMKDADFARDGKVVLIDGTEYQVSTLQVSPEHDLAMISVYVYNSPFIKPATKSEWPAQGEKVFTIGSPVGLRHTVTSGVISGYRSYDGKEYVQIDAPINPGNSGGPLITETGKVLGVNTMIIKNTQGIGFAIPIETVDQAFSIYR